MDNFIEYYKCGGKTKTPSKPKKVKSCACGSKIKKSNASKKSTKSAKLKIAAKGMKMKGCGCGSKLYRVGGRIVEMDCNNIIKAQQGDTINRVVIIPDNLRVMPIDSTRVPSDSIRAPQDSVRVDLSKYVGPEDEKQSDEKEQVVKKPTTKKGSPEIMEIQKRLKRNGYDPGPIDGIMRPKTRRALELEKQDNTIGYLNSSIPTVSVNPIVKKPTISVVENLNERPDLLPDEIYMPGNRSNYRLSLLEY